MSPHLRAFFYFSRKEVLPLAKVTKLDISIDLAQPVQEVVDVISIVIYPGRQQELLKQIDLKVSEALVKFQKVESARFEQAN